MRILICLLIAFISTKSISQEIKITNKIGYGVIEMTYLKKNSLCIDNYIGYEFESKSQLVFCIGAGLSRINFDFTDSMSRNNYVTKYFFSFPFCLKRYYTLSKKSSVYWEFGASYNYNWLDKTETRSTSTFTEQKLRNLGSTMSGLANFGLKVKFSNRIFIDIGIAGQTDLISLYKNDINEFKAMKRFLSISFNKML